MFDNFSKLFVFLLRTDPDLFFFFVKHFHYLSYLLAIFSIILTHDSLLMFFKYTEHYLIMLLYHLNEFLMAIYWQW
jgi:hypothetical protein